MSAKKYVCETSCYWNTRCWKEGATYTGEEVPPKHFREVPMDFQLEAPGPEKKMTLAEAQAVQHGETKLADGEDPKTLGEAQDIFA